jgi:polyisoprenoid-binding protein YceI
MQSRDTSVTIDRRRLTYAQCMKPCLCFAAGVLMSVNLFAERGPCVVPGRGHFTIHVGTAGLFGAFAHDHLIEAQKIEGCAAIDAKDLTHSSIKLNFPTAALRVIDPKESADDRAKVQKTMETEVLNVSEYPRVTFESTAIERAGASDQFRVEGKLTIRGKTQPAVIPVTLTKTSEGTYRAAGTYRFKQSSFGITPIKIGGGTVKVKDELQLNFEISLK